MRLELYVTARFKRDMRLMARRGLDLSAMDEADFFDTLSRGDC